MLVGAQIDSLRRGEVHTLLRLGMLAERAKRRNHGSAARS
jgi:hypothetical protein